MGARQLQHSAKDSVQCMATAMQRDLYISTAGQSRADEENVSTPPHDGDTPKNAYTSTGPDQLMSIAYAAFTKLDRLWGGMTWQCSTVSSTTSLGQGALYSRRA